MVGDSAQAIYGWRGARDVMSGFAGHQLTLSRSFRFGPRLAREANRWLRSVDAPLRLMQLLEQERPVGLVGGGGPLSALALVAQDLKAGRRTSHHELFLFGSWGEVQEYAEEDPHGHDLLPFVQLIDDKGPEAVLAAVDALVHEQYAGVVVSTAHKAKGREWDTVRIGRDFAECEPGDVEGDDGEVSAGDIHDAEARLAYVAVTRARHRLDIGGLGWINEHPDGCLDSEHLDCRPPGGASPRGVLASWSV